MIPFNETDKRELSLSYEVGFPYGTLSVDFKQIDVLRIIKALRRINNQKMSKKLIRFIKIIDDRENEKTIFNRNLPRRDLNEK